MAKIREVMPTAGESPAVVLTAPPAASPPPPAAGGKPVERVFEYTVENTIVPKFSGVVMATSDAAARETVAGWLASGLKVKLKEA